MTRANKPLILKIHSFSSSPGGTARLVCLLSVPPGDPASKPFSCPTPPTDAGVRVRVWTGTVRRPVRLAGGARRASVSPALPQGRQGALQGSGESWEGRGSAAWRDPDAAALSRRRSGPVRRRQPRRSSQAPPVWSSQSGRRRLSNRRAPSPGPSTILPRRCLPPPLPPGTYVQPRPRRRSGARCRATRGRLALPVSVRKTKPPQAAEYPDGAAPPPSGTRMRRRGQRAGRGGGGGARGGVTPTTPTSLRMLGAGSGQAGLFARRCSLGRRKW